MKLYNNFSFQGNVVRKLIIFGNVMEHLVPRGDFPLDVEGGFSRERQRHLVVQSTSTVSSVKSENDKPESASFLARHFFMIG